MSTAHNVEASLGLRVENGLLFHGDNPRPATPDEARLWNFAVTAMAANEELLKKMEALQALGADAQSYLASAEAYRAKLKELYEFLRHEYGERIQPTDDAIEFAMAELVKSFKHVCPTEPQKKSMVEILDARAAADSFGTPKNPTVGER